MRKLSKSILLTFLLATTVCVAQKVAAQPTFTAPTLCIPANPASAATVYTIAVPAGTTVLSVAALGDIEIVAPFATFPFTGAGNLLISVKSKNNGRDTLNDCVGYLLGRVPNAKNFGFGKGRLQVNYSVPPCNNSVIWDMYKIFGETPPIVGPPCIAIGDTVTYSVCSIMSVNQGSNIGQDAYTWNQRKGFLPIAGLTPVYTSGDNSSVTYIVSAGYNGGTLTCQFGQCNAGLSSLVLGVKTKQSTVTINSAPVNPNSSTCISTATTPVSLVATQPAGSTYTYVWSTNNSSWTFGTGTATATSASGITVSLNANESGGAVYLKTLGGCNVRVDTFYINRTLASPLIIRRLDTISCVPIGTNPITFQVTNAAGTANTGDLTYTWTLPSGWSYNTGTSQTASTIYTTSGATGGTVTVKVTGCATGVLSTTVNVKPAIPTGWVGSTCYTQGSTTGQNYQVTNLPPLTYAWSNTGTGWTGSSTTNSITYTPIATAVPGTVGVRAYNGACYSDALLKVITYAPLAPTSITVSNSIYVGAACTVTLTAVGGTGTTYTWTVPASFGTISGPATGSSIIVNTVGSVIGSPFTISVIANNACGSSASYPQAIPVIAPTIQYTQGGTYDILSVQNTFGVTYCWRLNNAGACVQGSVASIILQTGTQGTYSYTVDIIYPCGLHTFITQSTRWNSRTAGGGKGVSNANEVLTLNDATVNPNPANGNFALVLPNELVNASVSVYNSKGALVQKKTCKGGTNSFSTANWANGEYILKITNSKGEIVSKKVVVSK